MTGPGAALRRGLPWLLLLLQIVACFLFLRGSGRLELEMLPDTLSYRLTGRSAKLEWALASHRTLVYPAFLGLWDEPGKSWRGIPVVQALIYFAAVVVFFAGLKIYSDSAWMALVAAVPLIWARSHQFIPWAQTDSIAVSLTLAAFGLLFWLAARPASRALWVALPAAVLLGYHTRPSTIFLIGLVPLLAVALRLCRARVRARALARWAGGLAAATVVPYLLFALLRLALVGHFGLVAFGGANLIGVTANFIDLEVIAALPDEQAVLAERMRSRRLDEGWQRMVADVPAELHFEQYNFNVWQIAMPVTRRRFRERTEPELAAEAAAAGWPATPLVEPRARWIEQNEMMSELSRAIIRVRPYLYLHWVQRAWVYGLRQLSDDAWLVWLPVLLAISLPVAWLRGAAGGGEEAPRAPGAPERPRWCLLLGMLIAAASYYLIHTALVCLVSYPISRYVIAATLLWPPVLAAELFELWRGVAAPRRPG